MNDTVACPCIRFCSAHTLSTLAVWFTRRQVAGVKLFIACDGCVFAESIETERSPADGTYGAAQSGAGGTVMGRSTRKLTRYVSLRAYTSLGISTGQLIPICAVAVPWCERSTFPSCW